MSTRSTAVLSVLVAAVCSAATGCGPVRFDDRAQIYGTVVSVEDAAVRIRHKTGGTYRVALTSDTTIVDNRHAGVEILCPGLRATVFLLGEQRYTASEVRVWGGQCR